MLLSLTACSVDLAAGEVRRPDGSRDELTSLEVKLLDYLASRPGQVVSREALHRDVWGYASRVRSRAADYTMARLRRKIEEDAAAPWHLRAIRGEGYCFVPSRRDAPLPVPETSFVGRTADLARLEDRAARSRMVSVLGPGGVGKTRLAMEFVRRRAEDVGPDSVCTVLFCELADCTSLDEAADCVADALGLPPRQGSRVSQIGYALAARCPCLLVLDNLEQLQHTGAPLVRAWLEAAPRLSILATSRDRLGLPQEQIVELEPLAHEAAVALFVDRARSAGTPLSTEDQAVRDIATVLEGLPLALELAAAGCRVFSSTQLLQRLRDRGGPTSSASDSPDRHRSVQATVAWSWGLLEPWERSLLAQVSVFPDGFTVEAAEGVVDLARFADAPSVVEGLIRLRDRSLCRLDDTRGPPHLRLLSAVRSFALRAGAADAASVRERFRSWAVRTACEHEERVIEGTREVSAASARTHRSLVAAWKEAPPGSATKDRLGLAMLSTLIWLGPVGVLRSVVERGRPETPAQRVSLARGHSHLGETDTAIEMLTEALAAGLDPGSEMRARIALTVCLHRRGELEAATRHALEALDLEKRIGMPVHRARAQEALAGVRNTQNRREETLALRLAALASYQEAGARNNAAAARVNLATLFLRARSYPQAREQLSLMRSEEPSPRMRAWAFECACKLEAEAGRLDEAEALGRQARDAWRWLGDPRGETWCFLHLAAIAMERGDLTEAKRLLDRSAAGQVRDGDIEQRAVTLAQRGLVAALERRPAEAAALLQSAVGLSRELGEDVEMVLALMGYLALVTGDEAVVSGARSLDRDGRYADFLDVCAGAATGPARSAGTYYELRMARAIRSRTPFADQAKVLEKAG